MPEQQFPIGRRIHLPGHFAEPVVLESVRTLGDGFECRVRLSNGTPDEAILSRDEAATIFGQQAEAPTSIKPVDAESLRLLVESARIRPVPQPHRVGHKATEIRRDILKLGPDCPWALRRLKEDLRDLRGRRLFPDRHAHTVAFKLTVQEYDLYKAVTGYINQFLPQSSGRRQASVALARTVFQRRLASSTMAICESIRRRLERQQELLKELEALPPAQRARRLAQLQGRLADVEQDEDDLDDAERDQLVDQFTASVGLEQLQAEVAALQDLIAQARRVRDHGSDSKLAALKACLERAEFKELSGGRGKLLIFTEHRDTLNYLCECLARWGYTTCQIHGGMNPHERKRAQEQFRTDKQICVAAEDLVVAYETGRSWECERVGHLKIGFDVRSLGPADAQTGYRDPVEGIRRIEVKGRTRGHPIRLTTNEWYKAAQLGDSYWLYVVWDPLGTPDPTPMIIRNPVKQLDHAKREVSAARHYDIPAQAIEAAAQAARET